MLCRLAWGSVARARRDYLIYLLTLTLGVTVFYAFNTISLQVDLANVNIEGLDEVLGELLGNLTVFLGAVMGFLMVYANNFIMKRRNKEFGLYQVLGMTRGQVARIMALETVIVSAAALVLGIILGVGLSQLRDFFTASRGAQVTPRRPHGVGAPQRVDQDAQPAALRSGVPAWRRAHRSGLLPPAARRPPRHRQE